MLPASQTETILLLRQQNTNKNDDNLKPTLAIRIDKVHIFWEAKIFCKISTLLLSVCTVDKSKMEISQNFVAFSEYTYWIAITEKMKKTTNNYKAWYITQLGYVQ